MERVGDNQPDGAYELEYLQCRPGLPRHGAKGRHPLAHLVEQEDIHDARRSKQERGEDLQYPQKNVHRAPLPGFRTAAQRAHRAVNLLSPDIAIADNLMIIPVRVSQKVDLEVPLKNVRSATSPGE